MSTSSLVIASSKSQTGIIASKKNTYIYIYNIYIYVYQSVLKLLQLWFIHFWGGEYYSTSMWVITSSASFLERNMKNRKLAWNLKINPKNQKEHHLLKQFGRFLITFTHYHLVSLLWGKTYGLKVSHEKNPALLSIESWLVNRDPYSG